MADILLKRDSHPAATYVPNTFIDKYMTHADGEFVKVYLYLLRCINNPDAPFSISDIADKFDNTEKDVKRALKYWEKMHLLRLEFDKKEELTGICLTDYVAETSDSYISSDCAASGENAIVPFSDAAEPEPSELFTDTVEPAVPQHTGYSKKKATEFREDDEVQEILYVAERYLGRGLNYTETQTILYWLDKLEFSQDLIDYLIEQCVAKGRGTIRYMNTIAMAWAKEGVDTLEKAKETFAAHSQTVYVVRKALGISDRNLIDFELNYIKKWSKTMGFSDELIALACERTIRGAHTVNFDYTNSILENWQKQNAYTMKDVELLDAKHKETQSKKFAAAKKASMQASIQASMRAAKAPAVNKFTNFPQRTYDYEKLERELLSR